MTDRHARKFDPARAQLLDTPERERHLPTSELVALLELQGDETVVDYGAGTGRLTRPVAERLTRGGQVVAVEEQPEMFERLDRSLCGVQGVRAVLIADNRVPLPDASVQRVLAVNVLHELRGETALAEMRRLLAPGGFALIVDWDRGRDRHGGPPGELLYTAAEAQDELRAAGLEPVLIDAPLPFHFTIKGTV